MSEIERIVEYTRWIKESEREYRMAIIKAAITCFCIGVLTGLVLAGLGEVIG